MKMSFITSGLDILLFTNYELGVGFECYINGEWYGDGYSRAEARAMARRMNAVEF